VSKQLFGTDGIRGVPGTYPLDDATLERIGFALGKYLQEKGAKEEGRAARVLIGRDTRESGPHIEELLERGLAATSTATVSAGVLTTPGVAWIVRNEGFAAGAVISASHNPYHDNGVKLVSSSGMKFPDAVEAEIEREILAPASAGAKAKKNGAMRVGHDEKLVEDYLESLRRAALDRAKISKLKLVVDCANGAASALAPKLFKSLGAEVLAMNNAPDGKNINAGCGSLHPEKMQERVVRERADMGMAFDGDADRAIFSSANGELVNGDGVILAMGRYMKEHKTLKTSTIVGTTMANLGVERALNKSDLKLARAAVGDRYVLEEMQRIGANLGGEQSGHILFLDDATTGDGMLTAVKIASLVALKGPLDRLVADLKIYPQTIVNVKVKSKPSLETLPGVSKTLKEAEKSLGESGRVVLRYSGTEPLARVMVEAEEEEDVKRWSGALAEALKSEIGA
jgi:phosphoglucosamine mutase